MLPKDYMKFVFKKIKAVDTEEVIVLDKKSGSFFTNPSDATVEYVFRKPGEDSEGAHTITLKIEGQFFAAKDLDYFISFLQAAKQRLETTRPRSPARIRRHRLKLTHGHGKVDAA